MITSCEFHFGFWDVTAREDASLSVSQNQPWANVNDINKDDAITFPDVVTLEPGFGWPLNGSKVWFPPDPTNYTWGWWSTELSRADGTFANPPKLIITFSENHSSAGITLSFFATLPVINIKWYALGGSLLADEDFTPDSMIYVCDKQVENYGRVEISVPRMTAAGRFLRCTNIIFGALEILGGPRVQKATLTEELSIIAMTVPINVLDLHFFSPDGRFYLLDPSGAYRLFQWKQQITAYATINGQRRLMGIYYLQTASNEVDNVTHLELVDSIGILDTVSFFGGMYEDVLVGSLIAEILDNEGFEYEIDTAFAAERISGHIPMCTKREALQQIAFAIGAVVDTTRGGVMRFYPAPAGLSHTIEPGRKVVGHSVTLEELVTSVSVTAHSYKLSDEIKELSKVDMTAGRHLVTHTNPARVSTVTGATLVENHPNYAVLEVPADGEIVITGYEYLDTTTTYTAQTGGIPAGAKSSGKVITEATLVSPDKGAAVAQRVFDYYQRRYTDEGTILPGSEALGQLIELQSIDGRTLTGAIERLNIDLTGGYLAKLTLRGA